MIHYGQTRSGVTLIELIVTLALVMLMAGLGVQVALRADNLFVCAEIEHLRALIIYLQQKARLERRQQVLTFDLDNQSYKYTTTQYKLGHSVVFCSPPVSLHDSLENKLDNKLYKNKSDKNYKGDTGKKEKKHTPSTFKHNSIYCYPDGTISAGTVYLAHRQRMRHTSYYALTCGVGHISYIRIYCYKNNTWTLYTKYTKT